MLSVGKQAYVVRVQPRLLVHLQPTKPSLRVRTAFTWVPKGCEKLAHIRINTCRV